MRIQRKILLFVFISIFLHLSTAQKLSTSFLTTTPSDSIKIDYLSSNEICLTDSVVNYGKLLLNTPYHHGSGGSTSFDCSGFTSYVYRNFGYNLGRSSKDQAQQFDSVKRDQLKTGDLVYFSGRRRSHHVGHVGIVVAANQDGNFEFIHASVGNGVIISKSDEDYYKKRFIKANRVIYDNHMLAVAPNVMLQKTIVSDTKIAPIAQTIATRETKKIIPAEFHRVKSGETLTSISLKFGISIAELKRKNNIKGSTINPKQRLKIKDEDSITISERVQLAENKPVETTKAFTIALREENGITNASMASIATHLVKAGETLFSISNLYHITIDQLIRWNNIDKNIIKPGQNLTVNPTTETARKLVADQPKPLITKEIVQKTTLHKDKVISGKPANSEQNKVTEVKNEEITKSLTYEVKKGESLYDIAKDNNMTIDELKKINKLDGNKIKPDQKLNLTAQWESSEKKSVKNPDHKFTHKVHSGESYYSIAKKYGCKIDDLKEWNHKSDNKVKIGDKLIIHSNNR